MSSTIRQTGQFLLEGRADCRSWMAALEQIEGRLRNHHRLFTLYMWLAIVLAVAGVAGFVVMQEYDSVAGIAISIVVTIFSIWLAIRMYRRRACKFTAPARALVEQLGRRLPKHHALFLRCDFSHPIKKSFVQSTKSIPFGRLDFKHYEDRWLSGEIAHGDELRLRFAQIDTLISKEKVKKRMRRDKHKPAKYRLDSRYKCLLVLRGKGFELRNSGRNMQMRRGNRAAVASKKRRREWSASKPDQGGDTAPLLELLDQLSAALTPAPAAGR